METYTVGNNKPIKLKVSVQTEAIPMTYTFLEKINGLDKGNPDIPPFNPSLKTGWKLINKGETVNNSIIQIVTFLRFFNSFPNEETFNLAIQQIKNSYDVKLMGGSPSIHQVSISLESEYSSKTCLISSEVHLI